jgi:hypothetical protein
MASMQVKLILDQPTAKYTNLDVVTGKVVFMLYHPAKISFIVVKLEGESRTRLEGFNPNKSKTELLLEIHKVN